MFQCKKCNSTKMIMQIKNTQTGLYCKSCGAWQKWLSKEEIRTAKFNNIPVFKDIGPQERNIDSSLSKKRAEKLFSSSSPFAPFSEPESQESVQEDKEVVESKHKETVTVEIPIELANVLLESIKDIEKQLRNK